MKWLLSLVKIFSAILFLLLLFLIFNIQKIEEIPLMQQTGYVKTLATINNWQVSLQNDTTSPFEVGWSRMNIMPEGISPMAGYRYRSAFETVHDSLYCSVFVLKKGKTKAALITLDLLIFPPAVASILQQQLKNYNWHFNQLYLSASHTHNGVGNWAKGAYGLFVSGGFEQQYVEKVASSIIEAIIVAEKNASKGGIGFESLDAPDLVKNRLTAKGNENSHIKLLKFRKETGKEAALVSFTAHPTTINSRHHVISNDYPYFLTKTLMNQSNIEMAAFFAGAMGGHAPEGQKGGVEDYFSLPSRIGRGVAYQVLERWDSISVFSPKKVLVDKIPVYFDDIHVRILPKWRTRNWLFNALTEPQNLAIDVLKIDSLSMLSTPCDFSGELALDLAASLPLEQKLMITNFNGGYLGYITPDQYYFRIEKPETMEMNWLGPNNGTMMYNVLEEILEKTTNAK